MTITHFLDTSVCIPILRNQASISAFPAHSTVVVSSIVAAELWVGVAKMASHPDKIRRLEEFLFLFPVIEFDHGAARHYGEIRAELERKGDPIGPMDLLIAAHARSLGATLITANLGEFRRVKGLKVLSMK